MKYILTRPNIKIENAREFETLDGCMNYIKNRRRKDVWRISYGCKSIDVSFSQSIWYRWIGEVCYTTNKDSIHFLLESK